MLAWHAGIHGRSCCDTREVCCLLGGLTCSRRGGHREAFEGLAGDFFERAAAPLAALLARNGLAPGDLAAVELLGGGSRVPRVQAALQATLGGRALDKCAAHWSKKG